MVADYSKRNALPHLQSVVLVLWKIIFTNVSHLVAQANGTNGLGVPNSISFPEDNPGTSPVKRRINIASTAQDGVANGPASDFEEGLDPVLEELNNVRLREVSSKAISAILLMLLKWFKLSRESRESRLDSKCFVTTGRHLEIRVHDTAPPRRKLRTTHFETLRTSRH